MSERWRLDDPGTAPASGGGPRPLVILLHGVGADGIASAAASLQAAARAPGIGPGSGAVRALELSAVRPRRS